MTNLNLNDAVDEFLEWSFPVTHGGKTFEVHPLTLADFMTLAKVSSSNPPPDMLEKLAGLFDGPADEVRTWVSRFRPEHLSAMVAGIQIRLGEMMRKNSPAIALKVKKAMA